MSDLPPPPYAAASSNMGYGTDGQILPQVMENRPRLPERFRNQQLANRKWCHGVVCCFHDAVAGSICDCANGQVVQSRMPVCALPQMGDILHANLLEKRPIRQARLLVSLQN
jgi:hypothetical protein